MKEIVIQKNIKNKKQYEKDQQTVKPFDKLYRESLHDNLFDKDEDEFLGNVFTKYMEETKNESFL